MVRSGITKDELVQWGGVEVFNQALALVNSGDVTKAEYDDDKLEIRGRIEQPDGWEMPVTFHLEPGGRIKSACPCAANQRYGQICPHVVALGIAVMVQEMDEVGDETTPSSTEDESAASGEEDFIPVPMMPKFSALVSGSRASLSIELDAHYGEVEFPACSIQGERVVWLPDADDPLVRRTRSLPDEKAAAKLVEKYGFEPGYREGDVKYYLTDQQKVLNFLGAGLPFLRRKGCLHLNIFSCHDIYHKTVVFQCINNRIPLCHYPHFRRTGKGYLDSGELFKQLLNCKVFRVFVLVIPTQVIKKSHLSVSSFVCLRFPVYRNHFSTIC